MDNKTFKRIFDKVTLLDTGCWERSGSTQGGYYPSMWLEGKSRQVHRYVYEHFRGPLNGGRHMIIDHTCENKRCINPWHLEYITQSENMLRMHRGRG